MLPPSGDSKKEKLKDIVFALHWAATTGNVGLVKFALDHGVPIDSVLNGFVPLQLACINDNNITVVQYLIDRGANVNIQKWSKKYSTDKNEAVQGATGSTALHVACANGCLKVVDLLIRNNARVNIKDKYGTTALDIAYAKHETEIIKLLQSAKEKQKYVTTEEEQQPKKPFVKTHKRSYSDKQPRTRRPSLPSIDENNHPPFTQSLLTMTSPLITVSDTSRRSFSATYNRHSLEEITHSCPDTPRSSLDSMLVKSSARNIPLPRASEDSTTMLPYSPSISAKSDCSDESKVDWYGYGVVHPYDDENYLLFLERRAFNLSANENGQLERRSQEYRQRHSSFSEVNKSLESLVGPEEDDTSSESRPSIAIDSEADLMQFEPKRNWFSGKKDAVEILARKSLDLRPNFENLTTFSKRNEDSSDDSEKQQKTSFFSRWSPVWSRK